mgnify:CR=1 FL=1
MRVIIELLAWYGLRDPDSDTSGSKSKSKKVFTDMPAVQYTKWVLSDHVDDRIESESGEE